MPDDPTPQLIPELTQVGSAPMLSNSGADTAVIVRLLIDDRPVLIVGWTPSAARAVGRALLAEADVVDPPIPVRSEEAMPTAVLGRFPAGTNPTRAVRAVFDEMFNPDREENDG